MHVLDLKGVIAHAAGSLLMHFVSNYSSLGTTQQQRLDSLNQDMKTFQQNNGTRYLMPALRLTDLKKDTWHCLSGPLIKAANTRALIPWLRHIANEKLSPHGAYAVAARRIFDCLFEIEHIMYSASYFFTADEHARFEEAFFRLGENWMYLRNASRLARVDAWQVSPKVHLAMHLPYQARLINPRFVQCYSEESLVGKITKMWHATAHGPYKRGMQISCLMRYWTGLELRMTVESAARLPA